MLFVSRIKQSISNVTSQNRSYRVFSNLCIYVHASVQSKPLSFEFAKAVNYSSDFTSIKLDDCFWKKGQYCTIYDVYVLPLTAQVYLQCDCVCVCVVTFSSDFTVCTSLFSVSVFGSCVCMFINQNYSEIIFSLNMFS